MKLTKQLLLSSIIVLALTLAMMTFVGTLLLPTTTAQEPELKDSLEVTVYSDFGLVKTIKPMQLEQGQVTASLEGVAEKIDPTSVKLTDLTGNAQVIEQNYKYDTANDSTIAEKYIGKEITLSTEQQTHTGTLLNYASTAILKTRNGIVTIPYDKIVETQYNTLPEELITKPTLVWTLLNDVAGQHWFETSYLTNGLSWKADYVATVNDADTQLDFDGRATIDNQSGASYENANLKLVAGDVRKITQSQPQLAYRAYALESSYGDTTATSEPQFSQETLSEYHLYDLQRTTTLENNEQKQITFLEAPNVSVEKEFVFENGSNYWWRSSDEGKVQIKLKFTNSEANNLGQALPEGTIRVFKKDSLGQLQFIGEDRIAHTPKDEDIRLYIGNATDLVGERTQTASTSCGTKCYENSYEIKLRNRSDNTTTIQVLENIGSNWTITANSHPYSKENSSQIKFTVTVQPSQTKTITYTARYNY